MPGRPQVDVTWRGGGERPVARQNVFDVTHAASCIAATLNTTTLSRPSTHQHLLALALVAVAAASGAAATGLPEAPPPMGDDKDFGGDLKGKVEGFLGDALSAKQAAVEAVNDGNVLASDKFLRKEKCDLFERCVPTKFDYTNLIENGAGVPPPSQWPQCFGPFVLCSVANCTILSKTGGPLGLFPRQAECGCLSPPANPTVVGPSLVTPTIIKDGALNDAVNRECFGGESPSTKNNTCTEVNSAPVCKAINDRTIYKGTWPLISTFAAYADQGVKVCTGRPDGSSITADCMTAACYRRGAFDGSPFVCYCPVVSVPPGVNYAVGYPRSKFPDGISCDQPEGYVLSGA